MALVGGKTEHEVVLFSNASMALFPENKPQSFTCKLAIPLELSGLWYVGVKMIQFPCTWLDIQHNFTALIVGAVGGERTHLVATVPRGDYGSVAKLIEEINRKIDEKFQRLKTGAHYPPSLKALNTFGSVSLEADGRIKFQCQALTEAAIIFTSDDSQVNEIGGKLGLENRLIDPETQGLSMDMRILNNTKGPHMASLTIHDAAVSVVCPIAEPVLQGDEYVSSLLTVPAIGDKGKYIAYHLEAPTFHRVLADYLSTISVNLHFDSGSLVGFQAGKTVLSLIFTKNPQRF